MVVRNEKHTLTTSRVARFGSPPVRRALPRPARPAVVMALVLVCAMVPAAAFAATVAVNVRVTAANDAAQRALVVDLVEAAAMAAFYGHGDIVFNVGGNTADQVLLNAVQGGAELLGRFNIVVDHTTGEPVRVDFDVVRLQRRATVTSGSFEAAGSGSTRETIGLLMSRVTEQIFAAWR